MNKKKYKIKKSTFLEFMFSDAEDYTYWVNRWYKDLETKGKIDFTIQDLFDQVLELPIHITEGNEDYWDAGEVCPSEVELING